MSRIGGTPTTILTVKGGENADYMVNGGGGDDVDRHLCHRRHLHYHNRYRSATNTR